MSVDEDPGALLRRQAADVDVRRHVFTVALAIAPAARE